MKDCHVSLYFSNWTLRDICYRYQLPENIVPLDWDLVSWLFIRYLHFQINWL